MLYEVITTLRDLLRAQQQAIGIANIQKAVADYYGLQIKDLLSKRRTRSRITSYNVCYTKLLRASENRPRAEERDRRLLSDAETRKNVTE